MKFRSSSRSSDLILIIALVLSGLPLILLGMWENWTTATDRARNLDDWERKVRQRLEEFRSLYQRSRLYGRFLRAVDADLGNQLSNGAGDALSGGRVVDAIRKNIPQAFRPQGTRIYAFAFPNGGKPLALKHPDLQSQRGALFSRLFADLDRFPTLPLRQRKDINQRLTQIFGPLITGDLLVRTRQGSLILALFDKRPVVLLWDRIRRGTETVGAYLMILPRVPAEAYAWKWVLRQTIWKGDDAFLPALIPLESILPAPSPITFSETGSHPRMVAALEFFATLAPRGQAASVSQAIDRENRFLFRTPVGPDLPYELLVVGSPPPPRFPFAATATGLWSIFWLSLTGLRAWNGKPFRITMRTRMRGLLLLLGGIPLLGLFWPERYGSNAAMTAGFVRRLPKPGIFSRSSIPTGSASCPSSSSGSIQSAADRSFRPPCRSRS